jgi:hypothetical protein
LGFNPGGLHESDRAQNDWKRDRCDRNLHKPKTFASLSPDFNRKLRAIFMSILELGVTSQLSRSYLGDVSEIKISIFLQFNDL